MRFFHGHSAGDLIYFLPAIQHFGDGEIYFYRGRAGSLTRERAESLSTLLTHQSYIRLCCFWEGPLTDGIDLSQVVDRHYKTNLNFTDMCCDYLKIPHPDREQAWLTVPDPLPVAEVVINRCVRWRNEAFPWSRVLATYPDATFIGLPEEYAEFSYRYGPVHYRWTPTYLDAARVIAGCKLFIGNQSCCAAIAEGIKQRMVLETMPRHSGIWNCHFERAGKIHAYDDTVELPAI
jgi:hypothetical protein